MLVGLFLWLVKSHIKLQEHTLPRFAENVNLKGTFQYN